MIYFFKDMFVMLSSFLNNRSMMRINVMLLLSLFSAQLFAQEIWSLERCIQLAQQNNLDFKQSNIAVKSAIVDERLSREQRYPSLDFGSSVGYNLGRSINPSTNAFETQRSTFNSYSLRSNTTLYAGGRVANGIEQNKINVEAAKTDAQNILNNTALNVAATYLQIVLAEEQVENAKKRLAQTKRQLEQIEKLIAAGTRPQNERLDVQAQIARADQNLITQQNNVELNYLSLKQLLLIDPGYNMVVQRFNITIPDDANPDFFTLSSIYSTALNILPVVKASELRVKSAEKGYEIAKGAALPSVNLSASFGSNYTDLGRRVVGTTLSYEPLSVRINGNPSVLDFPFESRTFANNPYFDQLGENIGGGLNLSVSVPIYNNGSIKGQKEKAILNIRSAEIRNEQTKQQLKTDIQRAISNARAAERQYRAAEVTYKASLAAFENGEKRYKIGAISTFDFNTARNTLETSEVEVTLAKYDYIFKLKVVDFYEGKKMTINN